MDKFQFRAGLFETSSFPVPACPTLLLSASFYAHFLFHTMIWGPALNEESTVFTLEDQNVIYCNNRQEDRKDAFVIIYKWLLKEGLVNLEVKWYCIVLGIDTLGIVKACLPKNSETWGSVCCIVLLLLSEKALKNWIFGFVIWGLISLTVFWHQICT